MQVQAIDHFQVSEDGIRTRWVKPGEFLDLAEPMARDLIRQKYVAEPKVEKSTPKTKYR